MPPKHNFSKETDYRLIDLVELKPLLWDCTSHLYRRTDLKIAAWDEIAEQLGSDFTGAVVSSRFKNMKDTFARNLKVMKESKRSGAGTDNIYKPKWHMFERLMFLQELYPRRLTIKYFPHPARDNCSIRFRIFTNQ
ncbi:transcription factor Adf-1-like [Temnothorax longispinosus]|uniref:transcription factor Adf-1-like n=1 Tax=Temnothorax longispinosus TaxID=300112 RepID=UPI003A99AFA6